MAKSAWGIDISKYSVKCVKLVRTKAGIELAAIDVIEYPSQTGNEQVSLDQKVFDAMTQFRRNNSTRGCNLLFSLPGHSIFNRLVKLPPVEEAKIPEVVRFEAQSQIPFPIEEVLWDYQLINRQYGVGEEKEAIVFAIKKDIVEQFLENLKALNFPIDAIQFAPVALYNFLKWDQETGSSCVALDIGADNTDLILIDNDKFWVRNLPITGNDITKALQKAFGLTFQDAEKLKIRAGQSQQIQKIFGVIQPVLKDLVGEMHRTIGYYKSLSRGVKFDKIYLLGNASKTVNFQRFMSQSLQLPAFRLAKLNNMGVVPSIDEGTLQRYLPTLGAAIGLALQGLGETANKVNLLPKQYVQEKASIRKRPFVIAAVALLFLSLFLFYGYLSGKVDALAAVKGNIDKTLANFSQQEDQYKTASDMMPLVNSIETISILSNGRDRGMITKFFNELNKALGDRLKLKEVIEEGLKPLEVKSGEKWVVEEKKPNERIWVLSVLFDVKEEPRKIPEPPKETKNEKSGATPPPNKLEKPAPPPPPDRYVSILLACSFVSRGSNDYAYAKEMIAEPIAKAFKLGVDPGDKQWDAFEAQRISSPNPVKWALKGTEQMPEIVKKDDDSGELKYVLFRIRWKIPLSKQSP